MTKNKPIVYLDMDGVMCDLENILHHVYGIPHEFPEHTEETRQLVHGALVRAVDDRWFENMPAMVNFRDIEYFVKHHQHLIQFEVLTSLGSFGSPVEEVEAQKRAWLEWESPKVLAKIPFHAVTHRTKKAAFARKDARLIDDTHENVVEFSAGGGIGHLYTIETHEEIFNEIKKLA